MDFPVRSTLSFFGLPMYETAYHPAILAGEAVLAFSISSLACLGLPGWMVYVVRTPIAL